MPIFSLVWIFLFIFLFKNVKSKSLLLYETNSSASGAPGWNVTNGNINYCLSSNFFRGYTTLQKTITNLPSHYKFELNVIINAYDGFNGNTLNIYFDDVIQGTFSFPMVETDYEPIHYQNPPLLGSLLYYGIFNFSTAEKYGYALIYNGNFYYSGSCNGMSKQRYALKVVAEHNNSEINLNIAFSSSSFKDYWKMYYYNYKVWSTDITSDCLDSCTSCIDPNCVYCGGSYFNQEDVCVTSCSANYKYSNGKCFVCYSSCLDCTDDDPDSCISCNSNLWLLNGTCLNNCPSGYYENTTNGNQCASCSELCLTCNGENSNNCTSCLTNFYLSDGSCVSICPENQYLNSTNNTCLLCDVSCQSCDGPLTDNCLNCNSVDYWDHYSCVSSCSTLQYVITSNNSCVDCDTSCLTCNGPFSDNCTNCLAGTFFLNGVCVNSCPSNTYLNFSNNSCLECDSYCQTCSGPFSDNCTSCSGGNLFSYGNCINSCNSNQYLNAINNSCLDCDSTCLTCNGPAANNCLSCNPLNYYWSNLSCVNSCSSSQYVNISNNSCNDCNVSCQTCNGPFSNNCTSCLAGTFFLNSLCTMSCPSNTYLNIANNSCLICDQSCQTCSGPLPDNCTSCSIGNLFSYGNCINSCNSNQYLNASNNSCLDCDSTCLTCDGPAPNNCLSCDPSNYYWSNLSCVNNCLSSQYVNISNNSCNDCNISCHTCNGPFSNNCTSCLAATVFLNGLCTNSCPTNTYLNIANNSCLICDQSCKTCSGPLPDNCMNCPDGIYFYEGRCISSCSNSTVLNISNNSCVPCSSSCFTCFGYSENQCSACFSGQFLFNSECLSICPLDYYSDPVQNECLLCDRSCFNCSGSGANNCLSCADGFMSKNGSCLLIACTSDEYLDETKLSCEKCDFSCNTCDGPNPNNCLSCFDNYVLISSNNECHEPVNVSFFLIETKNPLNFQLNFYNTSKLLSNVFFDNLNTSVAITISNFPETLYSYSLIQINETNFLLNNTFFDNVYLDTSYLTIKFNNTIDNTIVLLNQSISILLQPFDLCQEVDTYYENGTCYPKTIIDYSWMSTGEFNEILLLFSETNSKSNYLNPILIDAINSNGLYIVKTSISGNVNFNYTFQINPDSVVIIFNFYDSLFIKQDLALKQNETQLYQVQNFNKISLVKKVIYFTILDDYSMSNQKDIIENAKSTTQTGELVTTILLYLSYGLNSKSTFAIKGILLTTLLQLLKFVEIMYPLNVRAIFNNMTKTSYFIKQDPYQTSQIELLLAGLPQIFLSYNTSLYILNNILDEYIFVGILWGVGFLFLMLELFNFRCRTFFHFFKSLFVWNIVISISLSKYITTAYFTIVALRFGFFFSKFNTSIGLILLFYLSILPIHFCKILSMTKESKKIALKDLMKIKTNHDNQIIKSPSDKISISNELRKSKFKDIGTACSNQFVYSPTQITKVQNWKNFIEYLTPSLKNFTNIINEKEKIIFQQSIPWENIAEYHTPYLPNCKGGICLGNLTTSVKSLSQNKNFQIFDKTQKLKIGQCIPWENFADYNTPTLPNEKKEHCLNTLDSLSGSYSSSPNYKSKSKIIPVSQTLVLERKNYMKNTNPFVGSSQMGFRFFETIHNFLYKIEDVEKYKKKYHVLIRDFKSDQYSRFQIILDLVRFFIISTVVVVLYGYAFLQMTIILLINLVYFVNMISINPFKRKIDFFFSIVNEFCLNSGFFVAFLLALWDIQEKEEVDLRINLGWILVFSYIFLMFSLICYSIIRIIFNLKLVLCNYFKNKN